MKQKRKVICRFAPSPTGPLHMGGVRSALFNYLYARQHSGTLILRIEDTDKERSRTEYETEIIEGFKWLGISFDDTIRQSDRRASHTSILKKLIDKDLAYVSKETPADSSQRSEVVRFRNPNQKIVFDDLIKGRIEFNTTELGDFVIAKSLEEPLFHLAVVADDFASEITHVIRGEDHISNTPRQILLQRAIGAPTPQYAHIPLLLSTDRSKLSKRKHGDSVSLTYYKEQGYLPEALINYLALLGWNPGDERELFTLDELIKVFSLDKVQKGGAIFSTEKLNWINKQYLLKQPLKSSVSVISESLRQSSTLNNLSKAQLEKLSSVVLERISHYKEASKLAREGEFDYLTQIPAYKRESLLWVKNPDSKTASTHLTYVLDTLNKLANEFDSDEVRGIILPYAEKMGKGDVLWPVRFALSGKERSIDPFSLISVLGKEESMLRLQAAVKMLQ